MILFTAKDFNNLHRGAALLGERWATKFPQHITYKEQSLISNWKEESTHYEKIVLLSQLPRLYTTPPYFNTLFNIPHLFTLRPDQKPQLYNSATNCFSLFKEDSNYKNFFPRFLSPPSVTENKKTCIGFYSRPNVLSDSVKNFVSFLNDLKEPIDIYLLGEPSYDFSTHHNVRTMLHSYNNSIFFSNISHYVYFYSNKFDPFPHSLLEAINLNKQIIIPNDPIHHDGVYDLHQIIQSHKTFNTKEYDNSNCLMTEDNFIGFYNYLIDKKFEYSFNRNQYNNLNEWIQSEVLPLKNFRLSSHHSF